MNSTQPAQKLFNRNFLLLWQAQSISRLGVQGFSVAMLFFVKHATGSAALMGILQMLATLPAVLLGPIAGTLADRRSRRQILVISDLVRAVTVLALSYLFLSQQNNQILILALFIVAIFNSVVGTFFEPAIAAALPDLVPGDRLTSANSLGQLSYQLAVFAGQGLGGTLYRVIGAPLLFLINGVGYAYAALSESLVQIPQALPKQTGSVGSQFSAYGKDILEGLRYVWQRSGLKELVFVSAFLSFFTAPVIILLPFYIEDVLKVPVDWYGFLLATYGIGTLLGYLVAGTLRQTGRGRSRLMQLFILLEALGYGALGLVTSAQLALVLALVGGLTGGYVMVNITTIVQMTTPQQIRGRVFGLLGAISAALSPLAMGLAGVVADLLGQNIPLIYVTCGALMFLFALLVCLSRDFRALLAYNHAESGAWPAPRTEPVYKEVK